MRASLLLVLLAACATAQPEQQAVEYCRHVTVHEDGRAIVVSTAGPVEHPRALFGKTWERHSLSARIDEPTGSARYELVAAISYTAPEPKHFNAAEVQTPAGPRSAMPRTTLEVRDCGEYRSGLVCTQIQHVVLDVSEVLLRAVATGGLHGRFWSVEFRDAQGDKYLVQTPVAEVEGLLGAVQERVTHRPHCGG